MLEIYESELLIPINGRVKVKKLFIFSLFHSTQIHTYIYIKIDENISFCE